MLEYFENTLGPRWLNSTCETSSSVNGRKVLKKIMQNFFWCKKEHWELIVIVIGDIDDHLYRIQLCNDGEGRRPWTNQNKH